MNKLFRIAVSIFTLTAILSLSACLVDEDAPTRLIPRNSDTFRTIQSGDYYEYYVDGQVTAGTNTQSVSGSLTVQYTLDTLPAPFNTGGLISPVLREDSLLVLGGINYNLRRYLQQNSGAISVLAVEFGVNLYRAGNTLDIPQAVEIIESPLPTVRASGPTITFDYMQGCETVTPSCSSVAQSIIKTINYEGDVEAKTLEGNFVAIRVDFSGSFAGSAAPTLFDMLGACDNDAATFFGSEYISPEVGIVRIETSCTAQGGSGHSYTARLSNTNVAIP